jgi:hypothetical protein
MRILKEQIAAEEIEIEKNEEEIAGLLRLHYAKEMIQNDEGQKISEKKSFNDFQKICTHCNKKFKNQRGRATHVKVNLTPKTYCCHCGQEFYYNHLHSHHKKKHNRKSVNDCTICNVSYRNAFNAAKEWQKTHAQEINDTLKKWFSKRSRIKKSRK